MQLLIIILKICLFMIFVQFKQKYVVNFLKWRCFNCDVLQFSIKLEHISDEDIDILACKITELLFDRVIMILPVFQQTLIIQ